MNDLSQQKSQLRQVLRQQRNSLSTSYQQRAAQKLSLRITRHPWFRRAKTLAIYWPSDGEISPFYLHKRCLQLRKQVLLPVIKPQKRLAFKVYSASTKLLPNRFGIPEPATPHTVAPDTLDLIIVPLVGFDGFGNRLGMGGGYYDRLFSHIKKPKRLGIGFECQKLMHIEAQDWDIPLHGVASEKAMRTFLKTKR